MKTARLALALAWISCTFAVVDEGSAAANNDMGFKRAAQNDAPAALEYFELAANAEPAVVGYRNNVGVMRMRLCTLDCQ